MKAMYIYYPGCTLKSFAKRYEESALAVAKKLGIELVELRNWTCCGAVYSTPDDDLIHHVAAARNLARAQTFSREVGSPNIVTLCAMCYHVLKRVNLMLKNDEDKLNTINLFMDTEENYRAENRVYHLLEVIRDTIGFDNLSKYVVTPLKGVRAACYYGCLLVKPKEVGIDDPENPTVMDEIVKALGGKSISFPFKTECCGAYQVVSNKKAVIERSHEILKNAVNRGANLIVVACPLCEYNLSLAASNSHVSKIKDIPILYFTELMCIAYGLTDHVPKDILDKVEKLLVR